MSEPASELAPSLRRSMVCLPRALLLGALLLGGCDRQKAAEPQAEPVAVPAPAGKVDTSHEGDEMPAMPFLGPDGGPATLTGFRGKPVLVNLWATWCVPCVAEMPQLDRVAAAHAGKLTLIAVSQDLEGKRAVDPFFARGRFTTLKPYLDKQNVLPLALKVEGLPATVLYDAKGREVWRVLGAFDWEGAEAKRILEAAAG
jgi:thiol-disulfide isomerase/thioredoxin